jgi:hypothetical protein
VNGIVRVAKRLADCLSARGPPFCGTQESEFTAFETTEAFALGRNLIDQQALLLDGTGKSIVRQSLGVVHIFVSRHPTVNGLSQQGAVQWDSVTEDTGGVQSNAINRRIYGGSESCTAK